MPMLKFAAKGKSANPTKIVVKARDFAMTVDEPQDMNGTNDGANPVEYLLAALAGCLNVVGYLVAREMDMELNGLEIELEGGLNPARFSGKDTDQRAGYQEIRVNLKPDTDADRDTLDKWAEAIEKRCPVSDNLSNPTPVKITVS